MNVFDEYPDRVEVDGKVYPLDLSFDRVLMAMDAADDKGLSPADKIELQARLFLRRSRDLPKTAEGREKLIRAVLELFPKPEKGGSDKCIDFHQDAALIRSAFFRMGIDLQTDRIHFFRFLELLADLPEDTALARIIEIRTRPLPERNKHNAKLIAQIQEAKARVAIKYTDEEARERFADKLKHSSFMRG